MTHPRRLIIPLTTLSVKLNTTTTLATYLCLALRKAEREHWLNIPPTIEHQPDRFVTYFILFILTLHYTT